MKKLLLGICALMYLFPLLAQQHRLTVIDAATNLPLTGVSILTSEGLGWTTASDGTVLIPAKTGKLRISSIGYRTATLLPNGMEQVLKLEPLELFLQPVEVKAIRAGEKTPFARTEITASEIARQNLGQDLPFLLNQTPSVVVNSDAGNGIGYTGIRIRGTDATRINMTLNGIPYNDAESQGLFLVNLPDFVSSVSNIQVQRGVGTSTNGAGAFGATINLSTHEFHEKAYGEINNSYGSFNSWKNTLKAGTGLINKHFTLDTRISRISSDGYIDRASSKLEAVYLSGAYINKQSSLRLNIFSGKEKTYQAWYGILQSEVANCRTCNSAGTEKPGKPYDNETDNYRQDHYQLFFNHAFSDRLSLNLAGFLTKGKGYYEQYKADQRFVDYGLPNPETGTPPPASTDLIRQLWLDNAYYGGTFSGQYKQAGTQIILGGSYARYEGNHFGKIIWAGTGIDKDYQWYNLGAQKNDGNIYTKWQQKIKGPWETFLDLQYRYVGYSIDGFRNNPLLFINNQYHFFNPKAGIHYSNHNWSAFFSVATAHKEPNRDDFEAGAGQQPKPESLTDFEMGLGQKLKSGNWNLNLFYMRYKDQLVLTGKLSDVGAYTRTNINNSYRIGVEISGASRLSSWLQVSGNLSLSDNKVLDFTEYIDDYDKSIQQTRRYHKTDISFSPSLVAGATAALTPFKNTSFSMTGKYVSRQYLDNTSNRNRSLPTYYVQDIRISYTVTDLVFREISLVAQVNNVFNQRYEPNGYTFSYIYNDQLSTENYVYPMAGVNYMAGVNIRL